MMSETKLTSDVVIVGGGVIGLTTAWQLAESGRSVVLIDKGPVGKEASWAGAGMLPPGNPDTAQTAEERIRGLSARRWPDISDALRELTGIDNGYRACGAGEVARTDDDAEVRRIATESAAWAKQGIPILCGDEGASRFRVNPQPGYAPQYFLPTFAQVRNPRHLKALAAACRTRGVRILEHEQVRAFHRCDSTLDHIMTDRHRLTADCFCVTAGAWSSLLTEQLSLRFPVRPVRGQIVLLRTTDRLPHVIQHASRYIVPRDDGLVLVGSTEEHVGFVKQNTAEAVGDLLNFGTSIVPALSDGEVLRCWSGLRPGSPDGLPLIGRLPELENAFLATGHFRNGLLQSTGTAAILLALINDSAVPISLEGLEPTRSLPDWQ